MSVDTVLKGTAVVPGVRYAPAVWISPRPKLPKAGQVVAENQREAELSRFNDAADVVAERLLQRSAHAKGAAAEVLKATAGMVNDRGWRKAVRKGITGGHPAEYAVVAATTKFVTMFEAAGGVMAERTTDLRDIRDRVIAQLRGGARFAGRDRASSALRRRPVSGRYRRPQCGFVRGLGHGTGWSDVAHRHHCPPIECSLYRGSRFSDS